MSRCRGRIATVWELFGTEYEKLNRDFAIAGALTALYANDILDDEGGCVFHRRWKHYE